MLHSFYIIGSDVYLIGGGAFSIYYICRRTRAYIRSKRT